MSISAIKLMESKDGLAPFFVSSLGKVVILAGSNGSGKTRLLKLLENYVSAMQRGEDACYLQLEIGQSEEHSEIFGKENANQIKIVNYSHFDAQLQLPENYTPYVISKAKEILKICNYEETALNSLLLLDDMAHGYSSEFCEGDQFDEFVKEYAEPFQLKVKRDEERNLKFFDDLTPSQAALSPGQLYLLRVAIACYRNIGSEQMIFILDEPELHLHPKAQVEMMKTLRRKFPQTQLWVATHSLALISFLTVTEDSLTVLHIEDGKTRILRSDSESLLKGLIGSDENRFAVSQLMAAPDEYACNKFAVECMGEAGVLGAVGNDPQAEMVKLMLRPGDAVVDYGAGKGRLLEEMALVKDGGFVKEIRYYAYDVCEDYADECRKVMKRYGVSVGNYYNDKLILEKAVAGTIDYVLLVNVLHEIEPRYWDGVFDTVGQLLKKEGELVIVERNELMVGEAPYQNGFLMITRNGANELFGRDAYVYEQHAKKNYIVKFRVKKEKLKMDNAKVRNCVKAIQEDAFQEIKKIKRGEAKNGLERYKSGLRLAFYLNQYANASLIQKDLAAETIASCMDAGEKN